MCIIRNFKRKLRPRALEGKVGGGGGRERGTIILIKCQHTGVRLKGTDYFFPENFDHSYVICFFTGLEESHLTTLTLLAPGYMLG